jgi:hypothetical protein
MFMDNPQIGLGQDDDFFATGLDCAVRLATRRFAGEVAINHAGPKERKAAEKRLRQLESEFEALKQGVEHRVRQMALIIHTIHSEGLYRLRNQTFDDYIRQQWKWKDSRQRAYQLLDYGRTLGELTTHVDTLPSELQSRALAKLPLLDRLPAWRKAVETSTALGRVTMAHLKKVVHAHCGQIEPLSQGVPAEKTRMLATLKRWSKLGHRNEIHEIMSECENLLQTSSGALARAKISPAKALQPVVGDLPVGRVNTL